MAAPAQTNPVAKARALIAAKRCAEAREVLAPLRGVPEVAATIEMLVAYSYMGENDAAHAALALRRIPAGIPAAAGLAVGRMALACETPAAAIDRFRRVAVERPDLGDAAAGLAESASFAGRQHDCLRWARRAEILGQSSAGLAAATILALLGLDRPSDAAARVAALDAAGADAGQIVELVNGRRQTYGQPAGPFARMLSALEPHLLARPAIAVIAAETAFGRGETAVAAALIDAAARADPKAMLLRHEVAVAADDAAAADAARNLARGAVVAAPGDVQAVTGLLLLWLHTVDHDRASLLRWARRAAWLAGTALEAGPDMPFAECVRLKNDATLRTGARGVRIAHALGAVAAEATFGGPVAVRDGGTHAHITVAGRELLLRQSSPQVRHTTAILFALEPGMLRWFAGFEPSDVLVDIGANIGMFTVLAAGISGCRVVAIEPFSLNVAELEHNVAVNGLGDRVTVMHAAATDRERTDTLYFGQSFAGAANQSFGRDDISDQYADRDALRETVRGVPIDALVQRAEIPFPTHVKIDVDGLEEPVIEGMRGTLSDPRFKSLRMEIRWHVPASRALVDSIVAQGYSVAIADDPKNLLFTRLPAG